MNNPIANRGLPPTLPRHLALAPAKAGLKDVSASTTLSDLATRRARYKRRGHAAHRGPAPSLLEQRRAAEKLRRR